MAEKEVKKTASVEEVETAANAAAKNSEHEISETWAQDIIEELDDFIEAQGIYLRQ